MTEMPLPTRERILAAADRLLYGEGIRSASMDAIAAKAGVTKRTLYYHFRSKDDLIAAYLASQDEPTLARFSGWVAATDGPLPEKIAGMFNALGRVAHNPKWKGCGYLRAAAELASTPGHPALKVGAAHKRRLEAWLQSLISEAGLANPALLARQIIVLIDGTVSQMLVHRDPIYAAAAGTLAATLLGGASTAASAA